jgi:hypothetical protein
MQLSIRTNFPEVQRGLDQLQADLRGVVLMRTVNRTIDLAKTAMSREIRSEFNVTASYVRERLAIRKATLKAGRFSIEAQLTASGQFRGRRSANVIAFGAKQVKQGVSVKIKKAGSRKVIKGAFIANKGRTVFVRTGDKRLPIEPVQTVDIPQMFNTRKVNAAVLRVIDQRLPQVFEREARFALQRFSRSGR